MNCSAKTNKHNQKKATRQTLITYRITAPLQSGSIFIPPSKHQCCRMVRRCYCGYPAELDGGCAPAAQRLIWPKVSISALAAPSEPNKSSSRAISLKVERALNGPYAKKVEKRRTRMAVARLHPRRSHRTSIFRPFVGHGLDVKSKQLAAQSPRWLPTARAVAVLVTAALGAVPLAGTAPI